VSRGPATGFRGGVRVSFPLGKPFLCSLHACGRNPELGMDQLSEEATAGADVAGFTLEIAQTNLFLAREKTASCTVQYNTLRY